MTVERLVVGTLQENCYIITKDNKSIIIDPGDESKKILAFCHDLNVVEVLVTHHHFDHIGALKEILDYYNLEENKPSGYFNYEVIKTPGHTSDAISFYFCEEQLLFSGDFLFKGAIGRTDLATGSDKDMQTSLKVISNYPDEIIVYPGHGEATTLGKEKARFGIYY